MSSPLTGLITLCLLLSCRLAMGADPSQSTNPSPPPPNPALNSPGSPFPGALGPTDIGTSGSTPAMMALPASTGPGTGNEPVIDASNYRKFYTISAELRETYDTNVNTTAGNPQPSFESSISPSILVDFPRENSELSARYTFGLTQYSQSDQSGGGSIQLSHTFVAQLRHDFSERFSLNASEQFLDSTEPNLFGTTGTLYRDGENISNAFTTGLSAQWTPLFGTQTTYTNTIVRYTEQQFAEDQDSMENTGSQSFSFSFLPKISLNFGGIADNITYDSVSRGYTSLTGFVGATWTALPSVTVSARGGGSYTETKQTLGVGQASTDATSIAPYADVSGSWQIGERSSLTGDYSHEVTPTDQTGANGQQADRVSANFTYSINSNLSAHLQGIYTYSVISSNLINSSTLSAYNESDYALDTGINYGFDKYFSVNFDITLSGVSSEIADRDYSRQEFSVGLRGTY